MLDPDIHFPDMNIADGAVNGEKIADNITLPGSPAIENRPPETASDDNENGVLIPDCQWVITKSTAIVDSKIKILSDEDIIDMVDAAWASA